MAELIIKALYGLGAIYGLLMVAGIALALGLMLKGCAHLVVN